MYYTLNTWISLNSSIRHRPFEGTIETRSSKRRQGSSPLEIAPFKLNIPLHKGNRWLRRSSSQGRKICSRWPPACIRAGIWTSANRFANPYISDPPPPPPLFLLRFFFFLLLLLLLLFLFFFFFSVERA